MFTGEQSDSDEGPYYLRARYYDPDTGRLLSKDPLRGKACTPQSLNRYAYVENNPTIHVDPRGLLWLGGRASKQGMRGRIPCGHRPCMRLVFRGTPVWRNHIRIARLQCVPDARSDLHPCYPRLYLTMNRSPYVERPKHCR
ncbi:MAG: RHS repeat-associated core domain-containing protein [Dehalococcoidia bacterium]